MSERKKGTRPMAKKFVGVKLGKLKSENAPDQEPREDEKFCIDSGICLHKRGEVFKTETPHQLSRLTTFNYLIISIHKKDCMLQSMEKKSA